MLTGMHRGQRAGMTRATTRDNRGDEEAMAEARTRERRGGTRERRRRSSGRRDGTEERRGRCRTMKRCRTIQDDDEEEQRRAVAPNASLYREETGRGDRGEPQNDTELDLTWQLCTGLERASDAGLLAPVRRTFEASSRRLEAARPQHQQSRRRSRQRPRRRRRRRRHQRPRPKRRRRRPRKQQGTRSEEPARLSRMR